MATKIINVLKDDKLEDILNIFREASADEVIFVLPHRCKFLNDENNFATLAYEASDHSKTVSILTSNDEVANLALKHGIGVLESEKRQESQRENKKPTLKLVTASDDEEIEEEYNDNTEEKHEQDMVESLGSVSTNNESEDFGTSDETMTYTEDSDNETEDTEENEDDEPNEDNLGDNDDNNENDEEAEKDEAVADFSTQPIKEEDQQLYYTQLTEAVKKVRPMNDIMLPRKEDQINIKIPKKKEKPYDLNIKKDVSEQQDDPPKKIDDLQSMWQSPRSGNKELPSKSKEGSIPRNLSVSSKIPKIKGGFSKKTIVFLGLAVLAVFALVLYLTIGSARVVIKPRVSELDFSLKVSVSDKFITTDSELKMIPGQLFSIEKRIEDTFQASGERDVAQKARGTLTVYNEYGTTPQTLIATTRFKSTGGLIFRTLNTVTIPGTKVQNGEITPGKTTVEVIADKAGDEYNVTPGKFTIAAFEERGDIGRYEKFYGISENSMKGGIVGRAKVVTESDYINAKKIIGDRVLDEAKEELNVQALGLNILSLFQPTIKDVLSDVEIDEASDTFTVSGIAELETMGFMDEDLHELIIRYVEQTNNLFVLPEKLELSFENIKFDNTEKILEFTVFIKGPAYDKIDEEKIVADLLGKNEVEITEYIKGLNNVASARVILSPFWVFSVPNNTERVSTEVDYD